MKKVVRMLGLCALVALAITSCKKDKETNGTVFSASLTQPTSDSRTHIGDGNYLWWNADDAIKVFNAAGNATVFTTNDSDKPNATFVGTLDPSASYCAFYPAANASDLNNGKVTLTLNNVQAYAEGSFANGVYPMAAVSATVGNNIEFEFHSPCGVLDIPVTGVGTIGSVELTGALNEPLAGQLLIDPNGFDPQNPSYTLGTYQTTVTLNCGNNGVTLSDVPIHLFFVVPKNVFSQGFTAVVKAPGGSVIYTLQTTKPNVIHAETIHVMQSVDLNALTVVTTDATDVDSPAGAATLNATFTLPDGLGITQYYFLYGAADAMTTQVSGTVNGTTFDADLTNLAAGTYYFEAYVVDNSNITHSGGIKSFTIAEPPVTIPGAYSTSPTRKVVFAPANLQYNLNPNASQSSTTNPQWRFAANQWEFLGENENVTNLWYRTSMEHHDYYMQVWANVGITDINVIQTHWTTNHNYLAYYAIQTWPADFETADSKYWMDLFCWGTSGYGMQPWNVQRDNEINGTGFNRGHDDPSYGYTNFTFPGYSDRTGYSWYLPNNQDISGTNYDWGQYNAIYNPRSGQIDAAGTWRTLTGSYYGDGQAAAAQGEWYYLMHVRSASTVNGTANARYCKARIQVNGNWINGLILFPDEYTHPAGVAQPQQINESEVRCSVNSYTTSDWAAMEQAYATFLPCAGTRFGWGKFEIVQDPRYGVTAVTAPNDKLIRAYADNNQGYYWSSTHRHNVQAGDLRFLDATGGDQANVNGGNNYNRDLGCSIRLAKTVVGVDPWLEQ